MTNAASACKWRMMVSVVWRRRTEAGKCFFSAQKLGVCLSTAIAASVVWRRRTEAVPRFTLRGDVLSSIAVLSDMPSAESFGGCRPPHRPAGARPRLVGSTVAWVSDCREGFVLEEDVSFFLSFHFRIEREDPRSVNARRKRRIESVKKPGEPKEAPGAFLRRRRTRGVMLLS